MSTFHFARMVLAKEVTPQQRKIVWLAQRQDQATKLAYKWRDDQYQRAARTAPWLRGMSHMTAYTVMNEIAKRGRPQ